jgi:PadR family transcriptional regulator, regulatory protein PadR
VNLKGSLPTLILQVLSRGSLHGYCIARQIKETSKGVLDFKEGSLYPALHGLEQKGLIKSHEQAEQGRTRRYYRLTEKGRKALETEREEWARYSKAVTLVMKEA